MHWMFVLPHLAGHMEPCIVSRSMHSSEILSAVRMLCRYLGLLCRRRRRRLYIIHIYTSGIVVVVRMRGHVIPLC